MAGDSSLVDLILSDHEKAKNLLSQLDSQSPDELGDYFCNIREELVRHEVAEEMVMYPALRASFAGGDAIADACIDEQAQAEETMAALDKEDATGTGFRTQLEMLRRAVLAHASHEEAEVLPALTSHLQLSELVELGGKYEKALKAAPTHPHPHTPDTPPGNKVLGPTAALVDRVRDAMHAA